ncbi:hypothetical protein BBJ28_00022447 [Nothophytophthora sp. Chile5]|nr:hypothetical protein BBJ28_00022447 [Nothophytophthora sp. Chile5]
MAVVGVQSALSGIVVRKLLLSHSSRWPSPHMLNAVPQCKQHHVPRQVNICLRTNLEARQATLVKVKARTLQLVNQHLAERGRFVSPTSAFADISRFRSPEGDYCALIYDVVPFEGIKTVKEVYDALKCYYHNMEIRVTEALGDVTIREDDGSSGPGISQCRVVSYLSNGAQLEMNAVICSHYEDVDLEYGEGRATGIFSEDFVDQDDLYPYLPNERVRQDVTVVLRIKSHLRKRVSRDGSEEDELVVVLTRWGHVKIHKTDIALPTPVVHEIREGIAQWGDVMLQAVRELVYHPGRPLDLEAMTRKKSPTRVDV